MEENKATSTVLYESNQLVVRRVPQKVLLLILLRYSMMPHSSTSKHFHLLFESLLCIPLIGQHLPGQLPTVHKYNTVPDENQVCMESMKSEYS